MIQTIKDKALELMLIGTALFGGIAHAEESIPKKPKPSVLLTEVVAEDKKPLSRAEVFIKDLPAKSDLFVVGETQDGKDFYKLRWQSVPLKYKNLGLGGFAQYLGKTGVEGKEQAGLVMRLTGKPFKRSFAKADTRYFPETKDIEGKYFIDSQKIFADMLWKVNIPTKKGFFRPGVDYKITKNISVGVEAKVSGELGNLKENYVGFRTNLRF
jgi:hypothetical protein